MLNYDAKSDIHVIQEVDFFFFTMRSLTLILYKNQVIYEKYGTSFLFHYPHIILKFYFYLFL